MRGGQGYAIFAHAEHLGLTVTKFLTGKDGPMMNLEMVLWGTYRTAQERLRQQAEKK